MAAYDWGQIRVEYELGASLRELARAHGVSKSAVSKRARSEGWIRDTTGTVRRLAVAKSAGLADAVDTGVDTVHPKKRAAAVERAADALAAVIQRHKDEWERHWQILDAALAASDFEAAKLAKITAETLRLRQDGERRAWGLDGKAETGRGGEALEIRWLS